MIFLILFPWLTWRVYLILSGNYPSDGFSGNAVLWLKAVIPSYLFSVSIQAIFNFLKMSMVQKALYGTMVTAEDRRELWGLKNVSKKSNIPIVKHLKKVSVSAMGSTYLRNAVLATALAIFFEDFWLKLTFATLSIFGVVFSFNGYFLHGRPRAILLLGKSGGSSGEVLKFLCKRFITLGVSALLELRDGTAVSWAFATGANYRVDESKEVDWRKNFRTLANFSKFNVVDCRELSVGVKEEISWLSKHVEPDSMILFGSEDEVAEALVHFESTAAMDMAQSTEELQEVILKKLNLTPMQWVWVFL